MPLNVSNIITRENESEIHDYEYIKCIIFKRYKLSVKFKLKKKIFQKRQSANWYDFTYEIKVYFQQWIEGFYVDNFEELLELISVNQIRHNLPTETRKHFVE